MTSFFVQPSDFGAIGDGVANDTAAFQAMLDSGNPMVIPRATYAISSTLQVGNGAAGVLSTKYGYRIEGAGSGTTLSETAPTQMGSRLKWVGPAGGLMMSINGPVATVNMSGLAFDCNHLASTAVKATHMMISTWSDIVATQYRGAAYILESVHNFPGMVQGANKNTFTTVRAENPGSNGCGISIGNGTYTGMLDVAQNMFLNCSFTRDGTSVYSYSLHLAYCDSLTFLGTLFTSQTDQKGVGVWITTPTGNVGFPGEIAFINSPTLGPWAIDPAWNSASGIICDPYPVGDGEIIPVHPKIHGRTFGNVQF